MSAIIEAKKQLVDEIAEGTIKLVSIGTVLLPWINSS